MLDVALATRPTLRPAIEAAIPGKTPKLYYELVPATAVPPFCLMRSGGEVPAVRIANEYQEQVYLDIWADGMGDIARLEDAASYLRNWNGPDYGNAILPRYRLESVTRLAESELRMHTTFLYTVFYYDRRNIPSR